MPRALRIECPGGVYHVINCTWTCVGNPRSTARQSQPANQTELNLCQKRGLTLLPLYNGSERGTPDGEPRRSFDLRHRRLFEQLDEQEREVARHWVGSTNLP